MVEMAISIELARLDVAVNCGIVKNMHAYVNHHVLMRVRVIPLF